MRAGSQSELPPGQHTQHEEPAPATQQDAAPSGSRFQHFLHAFSELFHESERFLSSVRSGGVGAEQCVERSKALEDVLRNQRKVLLDLQEQMNHVWVRFRPFYPSVLPCLP